MSEQDFDFGAIFKNTTAAHAVLDQDFRVLLANDAYCAQVGLSHDRLQGASILELFPEGPERQERVAEAFRSALAGQRSALKELQYAIADPAGQKREMWWNLDCMPLGWDATHGAIFLLRLDDVTAQVIARRRRDEFAAELQHRIGNVLTLVQIIARKTAQSADDLDGFLRSYENRIKALGKAHAFLSGAHWNGMTVRQVVEQQLQSQNLAQADQISIRGPDWRLSVLHAQAFAMAIHELTANAAAHGALAVPGGHIDIAWDHPHDGSYNFVWQESGVSAVGQPTKSGFGMQMIGRLLPGQLGGKAVCAFTPTGFHYMLVVPEGVAVPVGQARP